MDTVYTVTTQTVSYISGVARPHIMRKTWDTFYTKEEAIAEAYHLCNKLQDEVVVYEIVGEDTGREDDKGYPIINEVEENPVFELYFNDDEQKPLRP